tara:strand:+ start:188 stop:526 length:339 start_codon:yes stop_codon:yes gene_type:complete
MVFWVVFIKNIYAIDKCTTLKVNFKNQTDKILKNINSLKTCIKPASKYRLKSCIKRRKQGSKGFNCLPELTKAFNSNKKNDCKARLNDIKRSLQQLVGLDGDHDCGFKLGKN